MIANSDGDVGIGLEVHPPLPVEVCDGTGMSELDLFVYGQLTAVGRLEEHIRSYIVSQAAARVRGRLYWHRSGRFPVLFPGGNEWVQGTLLKLEVHDDLMAFLMREETAFGYDARWLPVEVDGDWSFGLAYCWPWPSSTVGARIDSGVFEAKN